ncbi:hypothetical protein C8F04DRAFT_1396219 [Mycena alexandri]|uniref:Uncharacterized protein n=1 Tax=Mycena alexandri TaxID=1745969 RepID=A0AAD6SSC5_9AGAR|nr:hypothetical protein C8F04DRAFT_1396219 [Mycena alexandri]
MSFPWLAQAGHNKAALSEGLKIVRKVIARDAKKIGLSTTELYKLSIREPPPPSYSRSIASREEHDDDTVPESKYGKAGRRRTPPPTPPHPRHPIRSISFLKHSILPIIKGEQCVRHIRETRLVTRVDKSRPAPRGSKQQQPVSAARGVPIETMVWLWRSANPPKRVEKPPVPRPPIVYDFSHMKASKRKAHRARDELAAKRAELQERREKLKADARHKVELERRAIRRTEGRARHQEEERAALLVKEERRKRWEQKNPLLAKAFADEREAEEQKLKKLRASLK